MHYFGVLRFVRTEISSCFSRCLTKQHEDKKPVRIPCSRHKIITKIDNTTKRLVLTIYVQESSTISCCRYLNEFKDTMQLHIHTFFRIRDIIRIQSSGCQVIYLLRQSKTEALKPVYTIDTCLFDEHQWYIEFLPTEKNRI